MSKKHFTEDQKEEIIRRYQSGESLAQIGASLETKYETIGKYLKEWGIEIHPPIKRKMTPKREADMCLRYAQGESARLLAKEFGVSVFTVRKLVKVSGGEVNPRGQQYRRFTDDEIEAMRQMTAQGSSQESIARALKTSQITVSRVLKENGIKPNFVLHARGENHGSWKGGKHITQSGYYEIWLDDTDPMASMRNRTGYVLEHRLNLARKLGRPLKSSETVHHINGDKLDNRPENLQIRHGRHGNGEVYCCADCGSRNIIQCEIDD